MNFEERLLAELKARVTAGAPARECRTGVGATRPPARRPAVSPLPARRLAARRLPVRGFPVRLPVRPPVRLPVRRPAGRLPRALIAALLSGTAATATALAVVAMLPPPASPPEARGYAVTREPDGSITVALGGDLPDPVELEDDLAARGAPAAMILIAGRSRCTGGAVPAVPVPAGAESVPATKASIEEHDSSPVFQALEVLAGSARPPWRLAESALFRIFPRRLRPDQTLVVEIGAGDGARTWTLAHRVVEGVVHPCQPAVDPPRFPRAS